MPSRRLTLWIARDTNVGSAVAQLETELLRAGIAQPDLISIVTQTAARLQSELVDAASARGTGANTVLSGKNYRIRITTQTPSRWDGLLERLLPWQVSFS